MSWKCHICFVCLYSFLCTGMLFAEESQEDIAFQTGIGELNELEKLLNTPIESASKTVESLFAAPLSSTVLTRKQIQRSGARTIPEALRLAPGVIVREQTAGNYTVHLRGLDNVPPHSFIFDFNNNTTLVMIDYRVVYSYYLGGTFWDALPVEIDDVERIEIVRGPASAMYGPNAVSGVINIITRRQKDAGVKAHANFRIEPQARQALTSVSVGYKSEDFSALISGSFTRMERTQRTYYSVALDDWVENPADIPSTMSDSKISNPEKRFPHPGLALEKYAANLFLDYRLDEEIQFHFSAGYQDSLSQKLLVDSMANLMSTASSETGYAHFQADTYDLKTQIACVFGNQLSPMGSIVEVDGKDRESYGYDFYNLDLNVSYEQVVGDFRLRPELSYRRAEYDGLLVNDRNSQNEILPGGKAFDSLAASLKMEYRLFEKLRLITALRLDYYPERTEKKYYIRTSSEPVTKEGKNLYLSYQFAATYEINSDHLLRGVYALAYSSPPLLNTFQNDLTRPPLIRLGNQAIDLLHSDNLEFGYRGNLTERLAMDWEVFYSRTKNFQLIYLHYVDLSSGMLVFQWDNLDDRVHQLGTTFSLALTRKRFQVRIFATIQETRVFDHARNVLHIFDFQYDLHDPANHEDLVHKGTPDLFAGAVAQISLSESIDLNINFYYMARHTMTRADVTLGFMGDAYYEPRIFEIRQNLLFNTSLSYRLFKNMLLLITGNNIFNLKNREFFGGDINRSVYMLGIRFDI